ncbi:MAG: nitroreductase family protein, partial [Longicatena sp.]
MKSVILWKRSDFMLKEIYERQSIRKYSKQVVEEEKLLEVLRAGMNAPTA